MKKLTFIFFLLLLISCRKEDDLKDDIFYKGALFSLNYIHSILPTEDGGFLIAGDYNSKAVFIKTDADFNTIWKKDESEWVLIEPENGWETDSYRLRIVEMHQNSDGNYSCVCQITTTGDVVFSWARLFQLNQQGEVIKEIEVPQFSGVSFLSDNEGFMISVSRKLMKFDRDFELDWEMSSDEFSFRKIMQTNDGGCAATGIYQGQTLFFKLDNTFNETLGQDTIREKLVGNIGEDLIQLDDSGFIIIGMDFESEKTSGIDGIVIRTNAIGDTIWTKNFGREKTDWLRNKVDWLRNIVRSADGSVVIAGLEVIDNSKIYKSILAQINISGQIEELKYINKIELITDSHSGFYIVAKKNTEDLIEISKIPYNSLFE